MKTNKNINIYIFTKIFENEIEKINKFKNSYTMAGFDEAIDFLCTIFYRFNMIFAKNFLIIIIKIILNYHKKLNITAKKNNLLFYK